MNIRTSFVGIAAGVTSLFFLGLAQPTWASGDYYVNANSADKSDDNSCRTKSAPCATLNGVINKILESATPQNSTIHAHGTFTEGVNITDSELEGLTLTWIHQGTRPVVNGIGQSGSIIISSVDNVSIKNVEVMGAQTYGIYAYGGADTHVQGLTIQNSLVHDLDVDTTTHYGIFVNYVDDAVIKNNKIHSIGTANTNVSALASTTAIYVLRSDRPKVTNNNVRDISVDVTFTEENSYVYPFVSGVYVFEADHALVKNNVIKDILARSTQSYASGYAYSYTYSIYLYNSLHSTISHNTILRAKAIGISTVDDITPYVYFYGIYAGLTDDTVIHRNKILNPRATAEVLDDEYGSVVMYGVFADTIGEVSITRNTIQDATAEGSNGDVTPTLYGVYLNDIEQPNVINNKILDLDAAAQGTGNAATYAIRASDAPRTDIVNNRLKNFTASVTADDAQGDSMGVYIDYNSSADILNNLIYFTQSTTQNNIDGIVVDSAQADPVRILHNTMRNMRTCLQVDNGATLFFQNNICAMTTSGAYGVQVDTDVYDLSTFTSNYNLFFNSAETVQMNDLAVGILSWSDWRSGDYLQDKKSLKQNPLLKVSNPNKKGYLHLKADSPAINEGDSTVDFGKDDVMNTLLREDWDGDARPQGNGYDLGADEFTL